jgi:hypothetical protein
MAKTAAILTIHGMGDTPRDYYRKFQDTLKKALGKTIWDKLVFKPLYYQEILQVNQAAIFERMREQIDWMKLRKFLLYGFSDAASLEHRKEQAESPYYKTQELILDVLDEVFDEVDQTGVPVIVLAQSLGCQLISNYIWDAQQIKPRVGIWSIPRNDGVAQGSPKDIFRRLRTLQRLYTTGCNIPIFVAGHKNIEAIQAPTNAFKWYNMFDADDVLGWPLKPLSPSYHALVEDISINAGENLLGVVFQSWNPLSHGQYWNDQEVIKHVVSSIKQLV